MTKIIYFDNLFIKLKLYGIFDFIKYSIIEIYRIYFRLFFSSFSQNQEDLIIEKYLNKNKTIRYIDIGSNHPIKFNNTYRFYLKGGKGVNIEPNSQLISLYQKFRQRDIILNMGISDHSGFSTFYQLWPDTASTFSAINAKAYLKSGSKLLKKNKLKVITLKEIFKKYLKINYIDLISIDTEGSELKILEGNNWHLYRSKIICIENMDLKINNFLETVGYRPIYKNIVNTIFIDLKENQMNSL